MAESSRKTIDVSTLSLEQLEQIRDGLTDDIDQIQSGLNSLKQATHGYILSKEAISTVSSKNEDKEILIPLTGSLYVPGKLAKSEKVLIDIGAGFYVEQNTTKAQEYFERRVNAVKQQMDRLESSLKQKKNGQEQIIMVMQQKIASISQTKEAQEGISGLKID